MNGPHAHEEAPEPHGPGPWGWPCPYCGTENIVREPSSEPSPRELRCDYCGRVSEPPLVAEPPAR